MINSILSTDMSKHFNLVDKTKQLSKRFLKENSTFKQDILEIKHYFNPSFLKEKDDRQLLLDIILHTVDIGHPSRSINTHIEWNKRIQKEF